MRGYLIKLVCDTIYDEIPVDYSCPHCERNIDIDSLLDRKDEAWDRLAIKLIQSVAAGLAPYLEALDKDTIRRLL